MNKQDNDELYLVNLCNAYPPAPLRPCDSERIGELAGRMPQHRPPDDDSQEFKDYVADLAFLLHMAFTLGWYAILERTVQSATSKE